MDKMETKEPVPDIFKNVNINPDLTSEQHEKLVDLLRMHRDMFSTSETDIGKCAIGKHRIDLSDAVLFKERFRRFPPSMIDEVP